MVSDKTICSENGEEHVLLSTYPDVPLPTFKNSLVEYILSKVRENAEQGLIGWIADSITGERIYNADIEVFSRKVASAFVRKGMVKGDVVIYMTSDVTRLYAAIIGIWRLGGIMYSSYPSDTFDTLQTRFEDTKAKWIFCDPSSVSQAQKAVEHLDWAVEIVVFGHKEGCTSVDELFSDDGEACPVNVPEAALSDPILVLATSGTTGRSKGAIHTNQTVLGFCNDARGISRTEVPWLLLSRCNHVLGSMAPLKMICDAGKLLMMSIVSKENVFFCIHNYKPYFAVGFPSILMLLATDPEAEKVDRSSLVAVCSVGVIMPEKFEAVMRMIPSVKIVMNGYGLSECPIITTMLDHKLNALHKPPPHTIGRLHPNTSLKVLDVETGKTLGAGEKGDLVFKSPLIAAGYWNRPQETHDTFVDGWLRTGDLGYYDDNGYIVVTDRIKDTFKYYNNHISPTEVESVILRHPAVEQACVFGITDPHGGDRIPRALVVLKEGKTANTDDIRDFAHLHLAEYKQLRGGIYIVKSLPLGKTEKVVRCMAAKMPVH